MMTEPTDKNAARSPRQESLRVLRIGALERLMQQVMEESMGHAERAQSIK